MISQRKKILVLFSRFPWPLIGGDRIKNYNLLKILNKSYETVAVVVTYEKIPQEYIKIISESCRKLIVINLRKTNILFAFFRSITSLIPFQVALFYSSQVKREILKISQECDIIYSNLIRTTEYGKEIDKPKVAELADSLAMNYKFSKDKTSSILWKIYYSLEFKRLEKYEQEVIKTFDYSFMFNEYEKIKSDYQNKVILLPHGVNSLLLNIDCNTQSSENYVVFFGKMDYQPNIDAVVWFAENVVPLFPKNLNLKFKIIGANPHIIKEKIKNNSQIEIMGFLENPWELIQKAVCVVAPMQTGGGIQNKILESMALGCIVISSELSAKALNKAKDGKELFVANIPKEYVDLIRDICNDPSKYENVKLNARNYIKENHQWSSYEATLLSYIKKFDTNNINTNQNKSTYNFTNDSNKFLEIES